MRVTCSGLSFERSLPSSLRGGSSMKGEDLHVHVCMGRS